MILGLDISTSCTGACLLKDNGELVDLGYSKPKGDNIFEKARCVSDFLKKFTQKYEITSIFIEENMQAFRPGLSSAKTLMTLARFNGIISQLCYSEFSIVPLYLNVNASRKNLGIKLVRKNKGGKPTKEQIFEWVESDLATYSNAYQWPTKIMKSGPRKGKTIIDTASYDMADAYVIARAGFLNN
jgi:hypothetical protein